MSRILRVAEVEKAPAGTALAVGFEGRAIALFNIEGAFYAIDEPCTQARGPSPAGTWRDPR